MRSFLLALAVLISAVCASSAMADSDDLVMSRHGTVVSDVAGDLIIRNGASVQAVNIRIEGNVRVETGGKLYANGIEIWGDFRVESAGNVTVRKSGTRFSSISGDVHIDQSRGVIRLFDIAMGGHVLLEDNPAADIVLRGNTIGGDLQLFSNQSSRTIVVRNNLITGNIQSLDNFPGVQFNNNLTNAPPAMGSLIEVLAAGETGTESIELLIDQIPVRRWTATQTFRNWRYIASEVISADRIRVEFLSNPVPTESNPPALHVDNIAIDGELYETESDDVYSTGLQPPGYHQTQTLYSDGYFHYGLTRLEDELIVFALNTVLPDGWSSTLGPNGLDVRLRTYGPNGQVAYEARFGAAGAIASVRDISSGKELVAPSHHGEVTDRVVQWTIWEQGQSAVYDAPSLPYWEDRFNIAQAGTYDNVLHATSSVDWFPDRGQWDVWARSDRPWKSELEPHLQGAMDGLTRTIVLDGGALLIRRIIRVGEIRRLGVPVTLSNPLFEAWNPFADGAFNSLALSIGADGKPDHWFKDSVNIPHYPGWPIAETRGWAIAYNRFQLSQGPTFAVVFGRDIGQVHLGDGTIVAPQRFVLNTMDFSGGFCILPALWPKGLPAGSVIDQFYILFPSRGIDASTAAVLDALSDRLPPPRVYHPGAALSGELSVIVDRLQNGYLQPQYRTDQLGSLW